jgi:hypothetical protein
MAKFERIKMNPADWEKALHAFPDRIVYQTPAWMAFIEETQKAEPVIAVLKEGGEVLGYFTGLIVRKFGVKILGSPFRGWSSPYMGFNLPPTVPRRMAVEALQEFAFKKLGCIHFEVADSYLRPEDLEGLDLPYERRPTVEIDLSQTEDELLMNMDKTCRWTVRKAEKNGVVIEEASDPGFADDYSNQLQEVFAKQGLVPHFGVERVRALIRHLHPAGSLLLLRARDPEGHCIATGLYLGLNQTAYFWGGASWRQYQKLYPNELLQWYAMRYWKRQGIKTYNMVGTMDFKQKFGGTQTTVPMIIKSKYRALSQLRYYAPRLAKSAMKLGWKLKTIGRAKPAAGPS